MITVRTDLEPDDERCLIVVFLRGGADGLAVVPPVGDDDYHRARVGMTEDVDAELDLDGFFQFHPRLRPLMPWFHAGDLAVHHAVGSDDTTRSHFAAQDRMELGSDRAGGGWLGRAMAQLPGGGALPAIALGQHVPLSQAGGPAVAIRELADLSLPAALGPRLRTLYAGDPQLGTTATRALDLLELGLDRQRPDPRHGASYPDHAFGRGLATIVHLLRGRIGLRRATIDLDGWDSHALQGPGIAGQLDLLGSGLDALLRDLGPLRATTSVVVLTEFGRRVAPNGALGTDHGRASMMLVAGGGVAGGMHARWPGLAPEARVGPGDLAVTTDYRTVLAGILPRHGIDPLPVFPDLTARRAGVT